MRFRENGPDIPDELLSARDQGRVVFFCGAGVSLAKAGLPDFIGLTQKVVDQLGVLSASPILKLINEIREIEGRVGIPGLISADKAFGLLEREFLVHDIHAAVALALKPTDNPDLSAHRILLDLATTKEGAIRLVTTNFDRLFDSCRENTTSFLPPYLPNPDRANELNGVIYLHGKANSNYNGAEGEGFVLSSSEFGKAYLSDGWATLFFREIIRKYVVVFIGYAADDPPVHYLLEALNRSSGMPQQMYAFQAGTTEDATARWLHKGVKAIAYDPQNHHQELWATLDSWAARARDPDMWQEDAIKRALAGPANLQPYERGHVAHIISSFEGAKKFASHDTPPPAEWLCVFDPFIRYGKPGHEVGLQDRGEFIDPFDLYSIDSDLSPIKIDPEDNYAKREAPLDAWDAFSLNREDKLSINIENSSPFRGVSSYSAPRLPPRLQQLGIWISKVANQPAAIWWAAKQDFIHPNIQNLIKHQMANAALAPQPETRRAWRYILDSWNAPQTNLNSRQWYELESDIEMDGWSLSIVRRFAENSQPWLKVEHSYWRSPKPPKADTPIELPRLFRPDIEYPDQAPDIIIPDDWLASIIAELRKSLETALALETEIGGIGLIFVNSIFPDDTAEIDHYHQAHGLSGAIFTFSTLFNRLSAYDSHLARSEFQKWSSQDGSIFDLLKIWAAGKTQVVPDSQFRSVILGISDKGFWRERYARTLLRTLSLRWQTLDAQTRNLIEQRILKGPSPWDGEDEKKFKERRAWIITSTVYWLHRQGCHLQFDIEAETKELRKLIPEWKPEYSDKMTEPLETQGGWVETKTDHTGLNGIPIAGILEKAIELGAQRDNPLIEHAPFTGLSANLPVKAFSALRLAAKNNDFPAWAWQVFLGSDARSQDKPKFSAFIAQQLMRYSPQKIENIIRPLTDWLLAISKTLSAQYPELFGKIASCIIKILEDNPRVGSSTVLRGSKPHDWILESLNSPTGKLLRALLNQATLQDRALEQGLPKEWLNHTEALLQLAGDLHRHAIVILARDLNWFYLVDPVWTERTLITIIDGSEIDDKSAFWAGFFWGAKGLNQELYLRLKPHLLNLATSEDILDREHKNVLASMLLFGWGETINQTEQRLISSEDLRNTLILANNAFRSHVLWQLERWLSAKSGHAPNPWMSLTIELLNSVWPRQKSVKSPVISARLFELAFSFEENFSEAVKAILPHLTIIDGDHVILPSLRRSNEAIVNTHPKLILKLLCSVLSENTYNWPYDTGGFLDRMATADSTLEHDERFIELRRKWDSR